MCLFNLILFYCENIGESHPISISFEFVEKRADLLLANPALEMNCALDVSEYHKTCVNRGDVHCFLSMWLIKWSPSSRVPPSNETYWSNIISTSVLERCGSYMGGTITVADNSLTWKRIRYVKESPTLADNGLYICYFCYHSSTWNTRKCDSRETQASSYGLLLTSSLILSLSLLHALFALTYSILPTQYSCQ